MAVERWTDFDSRRPDGTNTGLRSNTIPTTLPEANPSGSSDFLVPDGQEIVGKKIYGRIRFAGAGRVADCYCVGAASLPAGQTGIFDLNNKRPGIAIIEDNWLDARFPNHRQDGIVGHQFRAYRNRIRGVVDGFGTFAQSSTAWPEQVKSNGILTDVEMGGNWVEYLAYRYPDDVHTDGSHQDGWQHQGGLLVKAIGNRFSGFTIKVKDSQANPDKPWLLTSPNKWSNGAGTIIQDNTKAGLDATVIATYNWYEGALTHGNLKNGGPYEFSHNRHYRNVAIGPSTGMTGTKSSGYWIRLQSRASTKVNGLTTNTWVDGPYAGQPLAEPRDRGINYDS